MRRSSHLTSGIYDRYKLAKSKLALDLPISPNHLSALQVFLSVVFAVLAEPLPMIIVLSLVLFIDLLDGMVARARGTTHEGALADWSSDRISECLIFFDKTNLALLFLPIANIALNFAVIKEIKWVKVLPLRHLYLVLLIAGILGFI